ncbi:uncharacterized protein LOC117653467 [Thrips palmi]|uniref:Uncharacterized protein LOC117653467 n=1 Tax=Thrips palmi TaxID=161013 RepID=A0A6P9AC29_THRPL|nr:uncharacterized protein LOC117653467 [Thrips palmi]
MRTACPGMCVRKWIIARLDLHVAACLLVCTGGQRLAGPYVIDLETVEPCPPSVLDRPYPLTISMKRSRQNPRVRYFDANFTMSSAFDETKTIRNEFASWSSRGGWKDNALTMKIPRPCSALKTFLPGISKYFWNNLHGPGGRVSQCPVPPGSYSIRNLSTDLQGSHISSLPAMFYGKWRMDSKICEKDACFMCVRVIAMVNPKTTPPG